MFCSSCGKQLSDGTRFCIHCGAPCGAAPATAPAPCQPQIPQQPQQPQRPIGMRTAQEMFMAAQHENLFQPKSMTHNNGIKDLRQVRFQEIADALEPDEYVLFCLPYNFTSCVAFTNKRIIDACKMTGFIQTDMTNTYTYECVNSVQGFVNYIVIKITSETDRMYAPLRGREAVTIAVKRINDAISAYKRSQKAPAASVVVQNAASAADELRKFKELMDMGVITQEEFNQKKKQLLGF